jgi:prepilin-type N-terminal cleavage/methylation domain-containing protein
MGTSRHKGLTLIEMLIVLSILSILATIAAVSLSGYMANLRLNEAAVAVASTLRRVGDTAITRSRTVTLTISENNRSLIWSNAGVQIGEQLLPNDATVQFTAPAGITNSVFSSRGLPDRQYTFTITRNTRTRPVTLLLSGLVVQ